MSRVDVAAGRTPTYRIDVPGDIGRRQLLKGGAFLAAIVSGVPLLSACSNVAGDSATQQSGSAASDTLSLRILQDVVSLDPAFMTATGEDAIMLCVAENLVTYHAGSDTLVKELADTLTSSKDALTHSFTLKTGVQFQGGYGEVTAEDVKFSFERIAGLTKPDLKSTYQGDWATLKEVEITGTHSGVIHLSKRFAPLFLTTLPGSSGIVISKKAYETLGKGFAAHPIGSGPYEFISWKRGQEVLLRRFDKWGGAGKQWAGDPQWASIRFIPITDDNSADIAVETGDLNFGQVATSSVKRFEDNPKFSVTRQTTLDYGFISLNVTDPKLSNIKVRKAIRQSLDIGSMLTAAFDGVMPRANALISPEMPIGVWADAPKYQRDTKAAKALLKEAGVAGLELEMAMSSEVGAKQIAEIVQANLADIGIKVSIKNYPGDQMHEQVKSLQMAYISFSNQADPSWATVWFTGAQVGNWNFPSWTNDEFDKLNDAALVEADISKRSQMYVRMQQIMDEDAIAAWVMYRAKPYAHAPDLKPSLITPRYGKYRAWAFKD